LFFVHLFGSGGVSSLNHVDNSTVRNFSTEIHKRAYMALRYESDLFEIPYWGYS
jgi:hypothetical protein